MGVQLFQPPKTVHRDSEVKVPVDLQGATIAYVPLRDSLKVEGVSGGVAAEVDVTDRVGREAGVVDVKDRQARDLGQVRIFDGSNIVDTEQATVGPPVLFGLITRTYGSERQALQQRGSTYELLVQLRDAGLEVDPRQLRAEGLGGVFESLRTEAYGPSTAGVLQIVPPVKSVFGRVEAVANTSGLTVTLDSFGRKFKSVFLGYGGAASIDVEVSEDGVTYRTFETRSPGAGGSEFLNYDGRSRDVLAWRFIRVTSATTGILLVFVISSMA